MTSKNKKTVYKSFEQLRSELFPKLVDREIIKQKKQNIEEFGSCLANKAIDQMLATTRR